MNLKFYSHGKLLISGEYAVLDGALSLAVPTKKGQFLHIYPNDGRWMVWKSYDPGGCWFDTRFPMEELWAGNAHTMTDDIRGRLLAVLLAARKLNPEFLSGQIGFSVESRLEFPRDWGLGSSSSLLSNLAQWAAVDAFELQRRSFGGSGYDVACATRSHPILYQINNGLPKVREVAFKPPFSGQLYYVHLNRKQDSREGIAAYRRAGKHPKSFIAEVSELTRNILKAQQLQDFEGLIEDHENLLAGILGMPTVKESYFQDYPGSIKSLGAWGGDFVLATARGGFKEYFTGKGYPTIIPFDEMVW